MLAWHLFLARRCVSTRPGQPLRLSIADRGPSALAVPGSLLVPEAERLGVVEPTPGTVLETRPVPASPAAAAVARAAYGREMATARAGFAAEVAASRKRAEASAIAWRTGVLERKAETAALKAERARARGEAVAAGRARSREARAIREDLGARAAALAAARVDEARGRWITALVADAAAKWVPEDKIDEVITPELFSAKYAWQFTRWFEAKDKKKRLVEAARRAKKPGVPLREVFLEGSDAEFEADWESSDESALAAGARPHGADLADADAAADGSGLTTAALAVARLAARRRGAPFPEPNFDAGGAALDELSDQVARMRAVRGVTVPELVRGKDGARIVAEYEAWVEAGDSANSPSSSMGASATAAVAPVPADNGERAAENAYIAHLVDSRNHEALYYALVRKRRRLERGGAPHSSSFARFAAVWGPWLQEVDARAFGAGVMGMGAGNAGGGAPAAAAAAAASARERARAADAASQAAEVAQLTEALLAAVGVKAGAGSSAEDAVADAAGAAAPGGALDARNLIHASRLAAAAKKVPLPADAAAADAGKEGPPADKKGRE